MRFRDYIWLWKISRVCAGGSLRDLKGRFAFTVSAFRFSSSLHPFLHAAEGSLINKLITQRPETVGAVVWPYLCHTWATQTRLDRIKEHYSVIDSLSSRIDFPMDGALKLLDLGKVYEGLHVVLDQPIWFMREGQLVINLFLDNTRIFSLAFSLALESERVVAYVGAMQGRNIEGLLDKYREITKVMHGMRPRDFLFELFRAFCRALDVSKIYAVSDASRHHRSAYFGNKAKNGELTLNYDEIWLERGGALYNSDFYVFDVNQQIRNLDDVPSKKRSMYRKRFEFLEETEAQILEVCKNLDNKRLLEHPFNSL